MVQAANSIEMFARQNCASILLAYEAAKSTALEKPVQCGGGGRNFLSPMDHLYKCKDCGQRFATFQALGGHRASHVKHRFTNQEPAALTIAVPGSGGHGGFVLAPRPARLKIHECRECRDRFPTGQALGGHMRKHAVLSAKRKRAQVEGEKLPESPKNKCDETFPVLNESKKSRKVVLDLDLNLPPPEDEFLL